MNQRRNKARHDARTVRLALLWADHNLELDDDEVRYFDADLSGDYDSGPTCGRCGAGVNPQEESECWFCGEYL